MAVEEETGQVNQIEAPYEVIEYDFPTFDPQDFPEVEIDSEETSYSPLEKHASAEGKEVTKLPDYDKIPRFSSWSGVISEMIEDLNNALDIEVKNTRNNRLPHESYWIGDRIVNVSGIAHGQHKILTPSDEVRGYLAAELTDIIEDDVQVYLEEGFQDLVFPEFRDHDQVGEIDDHDILDHDIISVNLGGSSGQTEQGKRSWMSRAANYAALAKFLVPAAGKILADLSRYDKHAVHRQEEISLYDAMMYSMKDPEMLSNLQRGMMEVDLPSEFYESKEKLENEAPPPYSTLTRYADKTMQGRSEYMLDEAMRESEPGDEIWLILGAGHQREVEKYIEN